MKGPQKDDIKIIVGNLNAKIGKETNYFATTGKESLPEESNGNGVRLITSPWQIIGGTGFRHKVVQKSNETIKQIYHIVIMPSIVLVS